MSTPLYSSLAPLNTCGFPDLKRQIGICVSAPFLHHGLKKDMVDIFYEVPTHNTQTFGGVVSINDWEGKAREFTLRVIAEIDKEIAELQAHRNRLSGIKIP